MEKPAPRRFDPLRSNLIGSLHICGAGTRRLLCPSRASASHRAPRVPRPDAARPDAASPRDNRPLPLTPHTQGGGGGWAAAVTGLGRVAARQPPGPSRRWASFHVAASRPAVTGRPGAGCTRGPSRARVAGCPVSAPRGLATRTGPLLRGLAPALSESRRAPIRVSQGPYPSLAGPLSESRQGASRLLVRAGPPSTRPHASARGSRARDSRRPSAEAQRRGPAQRQRRGDSAPRQGRALARTCTQAPTPDRAAARTWARLCRVPGWAALAALGGPGLWRVSRSCCSGAGPCRDTSSSPCTRSRCSGAHA